ncbi:UNVERIFIED_ORG: hypothetical protein M2328_006109 [Rhodococcus erythropolis]
MGVCVIARDLLGHVGRVVQIDYNLPWDDWDYSKSGRLNSVELEKDPSDPRYPMLYVGVGNEGYVGFWADDDVSVRFLDVARSEAET